MPLPFDLAEHCAQVARDMRTTAQRGTFDGRMTPRAQRYLEACRFVDDATACVLIFTRDTGHHSSGWMKNPDYERCEHLSISRAPSGLVLASAQRADRTRQVTARWLRAFFGEHARKTWEESAKSEIGRLRGVTHWRLFCDEHWQPILPRGEVYTLDFTEKGWRSASQVLEEEGRVIVSTVDPQ